MKRLLALVLVCAVVFAVMHRLRLYVWDPVAKVTRDGDPVSGARVMINYPNDVLLQDGSAGRQRIYLVQHWNKVAETPTAPVRCLRWLACLTDADQATAEAIPVGARGRRSSFEGVTMTDRMVEFVDEDGALVTVTLH